LRSYAAWISEADQRAVDNLAARMPSRPGSGPLPTLTTVGRQFLPTTATETLAVTLRDEILTGTRSVGSALPAVKQLARDYEVPSQSPRAQSDCCRRGTWSRSRAGDQHASPPPYLKSQPPRTPPAHPACST